MLGRGNRPCPFGLLLRRAPGRRRRPLAARLADPHEDGGRDAVGHAAQGLGLEGHAGLLPGEHQPLHERLSLPRIVQVQPLPVAHLAAPLDGDERFLSVAIEG